MFAQVFPALDALRPEALFGTLLGTLGAPVLIGIALLLAGAAGCIGALSILGTEMRRWRR